MWHTGLVLAAALVGQPQAATLESCEFVEDRWVCRYRLPEIELLGDPSRPPLPAAPGGADVAGRDPGVLNEAESRLVARCAEAGWLSLCFPAERAEARRLRDEARAYEAARLRVGELIRDGDCDGATAHALGGGYLALARESQAFCRR